MFRRLALLAGAALLLIAIGSASRLDHLSRVVALSFVPLGEPTASPTPAPFTQPSPRGGLGNTRRDLEDVYGRPTGLQGTMIAYHDGKYAATYVADRATAVLLNYSADPVNLVTARERARSLLPSDAAFVGTLGAGPSRIADVYQSAHLGTEVAPPSDGTPRGQLAVIYDLDASGGVKNVLLTIGQVPPSQ